MIVSSYGIRRAILSLSTDAAIRPRHIRFTKVLCENGLLCRPNGKTHNTKCQRNKAMFLGYLAFYWTFLEMLCIIPIGKQRLQCATTWGCGASYTSEATMQTATVPELAVAQASRKWLRVAPLGPSGQPQADRGSEPCSPLKGNSVQGALGGGSASARTRSRLRRTSGSAV
jgi:hypothetical protein